MFKNPLFLKHNFCLNLIKTIYDDNIMNTNFPHRIEYDLKVMEGHIIWLNTNIMKMNIFLKMNFFRVTQNYLCVIERLHDLLIFRFSDFIQLLLRFLWTTFVLDCLQSNPNFIRMRILYKKFPPKNR